MDAQGNALHVDSTRLAKVQFGDVTFREKFIVSGVTTPLLSLGNIMRSGWSIHNDGTSQWLTKDDMWNSIVFEEEFPMCQRFHPIDSGC